MVYSAIIKCDMNLAVIGVGLTVGDDRRALSLIENFIYSNCMHPCIYMTTAQIYGVMTIPKLHTDIFQTVLKILY